MKKYLVLYHAPDKLVEKMKDADPEMSKEGMKEWMQWADKCGDNMVDLGNPVVNGQKVTKSGTTPSNKGVAGYSFLQAENMDEVVKLLEDHPHLNWDDACDIEVHEVMPLPSE